MSAFDAPDPKMTPTALTAALRALDDDDRHRLSASAAVEARLLADVRSIAWARRRRQLRMMLAAAAALVIAVAGVWVSSLNTNVAPSRTQARAAEIRTEFMPLMYGDVPMTDGQLVRLEVPRVALATFGLAPREALDSNDARRTVVVDVLVGEDGLARAVRFVRASPRAGSSRP
jgi:hypothetical protein